MCARRLLFWGLWGSLSSPRFCSWMCEFRVHCWVVQGSPYFVVQISMFFHTVVRLHAFPRFAAVGSLSPSRQIPGARSTAERQATCQVASTQASTDKNESAKVCVSLAHVFELCWPAKLSCGSLRRVGKISPSACGLTESKLQRIEETVSVKASRGRVRSGAMSLLPGAENLGLGGLLGFWIKGHCSVKVELCCVPVVSMSWRRCRASVACQKAASVVAGELSVGTNTVPSGGCASECYETVWMMPLL